MDKAKALTGQYASKKIAANQPELTHKLCRKWKLYCPECYQFVHWRKSESEGKSSYFAHYDFEDKRCKYRVNSSSNNAEVNRNNNGNQGQDLDGIQKDLEGIISNYIADNFKIHNLTKIDDYTIQNCIEYYLVIVNNEKTLKQRIEANYPNGFYKKNSCKISKAVCKILSINMNRAILSKLIWYAIDINDSSNFISYSNSFIEATVNLLIKIIADIDWTKDETQFKIIDKGVKNIASNPESVSYPQAGAVKKAFIQGIKLPVKEKDVIKLGTFNAEVIQERIPVNKFLDAREIANAGITEPNQKIPIYRVCASGYVGKELYSYGMVGTRLIINRKGVKLPPRVDLKAFHSEVKNVEYTVALNSFECCARNQLGVHFAVVNAIYISKEFYNIRQKTQVQYDTNTNNIFEPLPEDLIITYGIFTYRAVELIQRYLKLDQSADATNRAMQQKYRAMGIDVSSYLGLIHDKLAESASTIEEDFVLKDAIKHFKGTNGM